MKLIKNIILLCSTAFITNSCQQGLLDTNPYQAMGSGQMWTNESLADMGVNAIYNTFRYDRIGRRIMPLPMSLRTVTGKLFCREPQQQAQICSAVIGKNIMKV